MLDRGAVPGCYLTENRPRSRSPIQSYPLEADAATIFAPTLIPSELTAPLSLFSPSVPPALIRALSPYSTCELPPLTDGNCTLHPLLERSHGLPKIQWHTETPPITARCPQLHQDDDDWWNEPATIPLQRSITIQVSVWNTHIVVFPNDPTVPFVTIFDVLHCVFRTALERASEQARATTQSEALSVKRQSEVNGPPTHSLLFSAVGQTLLTDCADENRDRGSGRNLGAKQGEQVPMSGQSNWGGLQASSTEHGVWDLLLG
ncbi:hypothetical protein MD484_g1406, partial [Candolleomyces efflorescens]